MKKTSQGGCPFHLGMGGELHQEITSTGEQLTTNQGIPVSDNQNSLTSNLRGPTLLEDFVLREKITHFDHERIPERIVHARGSGAHGYFQCYEDFSRLTRAGFLRDPSKKTPVFVRFSTVAGGAGSGDLPRDVRGFAVKFYTEEGNFDLVGNNIPIFFIQDAMKFPDLVHSVKMEADRGFPQAGSAHDTFWDFASLMPESMHMLMWAMSDRAIPRSLRMIEGFGIHTFRFVNAQGASVFVKFHWRPLLGMSSVLWDEAVKINGADPDFHRRDLWKAIENGDFPEWEFAVQTFDEETAKKLDFDVLDPTKLIPEEIIPLQKLGKLTLDRNPDNFFAETEQIAYHPGHVVPGIDFSNDPLLQGRLFSYLDTQLSRLGGPNFHEIPINRPKCPIANFQRDGMMRMAVAKGRVNYEPNSLSPDGPRASIDHGFRSFPSEEVGEKGRTRPDSFADHYSQARLFWRSMTEPEQRHIADAFAFELGKVEILEIRKRMLGHLRTIDDALGTRVEKLLGMEGAAVLPDPKRKPIDLPPSPTLSILQKAQPTLKGRVVGVLISEGVDSILLSELRKAVEAEGARVELIGPKVGGARAKDGTNISVNHALSGAPSFFYDTVAVLLGADSAESVSQHAAAIDWVRDAHGHLKVVGINAAGKTVFNKAGLQEDGGIITLETFKDVPSFVTKAKAGRIWDREPKVRPAM